MRSAAGQNNHLYQYLNFASRLPEYTLVSVLVKRYLLAAPAKSGAGISLLNLILATYTSMSCDRFRLNGGPGGGVARRAGIQYDR